MTETLPKRPASRVRIVMTGRHTDVLSGVLAGALARERDFRLLGPLPSLELDGALAAAKPPQVVLLLEDAKSDAEAAWMLARHPDVALLRISTIDGKMQAYVRRPGIRQLIAIIRACSAPAGEGQNGHGNRQRGVARTGNRGAVMPRRPKRSSRELPGTLPAPACCAAVSSHVHPCEDRHPWP